MARIITCGFEMQNISPTAVANVAEGEGYRLTASPEADTTIKRSGAASLKVNAASEYANWLSGSSWTYADDRTYWMRVYVYIDGDPTGRVYVATVYSGNTRICGVMIESTGLNTERRLRLMDSASVTFHSGTTVLAINTWHRIDFKFMRPSTNPTTTGQLEYWLNDVQQHASTTANLSASVPNQFRAGQALASSPGINVYCDDVAVNDDQTGGDQTGRPTPGKILLASPTSDVSRASWTDGTGGTTNLYQAVDNLPPTGKALATPPAATDQIRNTATGSMTNERYVGNTASYLGLISTDVVKIVQAVATVSNSAATARAVGVQAYSNPTDTEQTANTPALATTNYPSTAWATIRGQVNYNPTVANSASQVAVRKTVASDELSCAYLGLYVEYLPILTLDLSDSVTSSDTPASAPEAVKADTVTPSESRTATVGAAQADTVTPSDARTAAVGAVQAETVTPSDAQTSAPEKGLSDSTTPTDAEVADVGAAQDDSVTLSDALTAAGNLALGDSVTLTDDLAFSGDVSLDLTDAVTVTDDVQVVSMPDVTAPQGGWPRSRKRFQVLRLEDHVYVFDHLEAETQLDPILRREEEELLALI
jgi:uncharacterized protein YaiE (UPF0345 family)